MDLLNSNLETHILFSQLLPGQDLGFVDSKASFLELEVAGRDLTISQSPTLLSSNRKGGTTGAGQNISCLAQFRPLTTFEQCCGESRHYLQTGLPLPAIVFLMTPSLAPAQP